MAGYFTIPVDAEGNIISDVVKTNIKQFIVGELPDNEEALVQGWDGLYVEDFRGDLVQVTKEQPSWLGLYGDVEGDEPIVNDTIQDISRAKTYDISDKLEIILFSKGINADRTDYETIPNGWVRRRASLTDPWIVDTANTAWDGTVVVETMSTLESIDGVNLVTRTGLIAAGSSFNAPHQIQDGDPTNYYWQTIYPDRPKAIATFNNNVTITTDSGVQTVLQKEPTPPNTYYQTVASGGTPWRPTSTTAALPGSTVQTQNAAPGTRVIIYGGNDGAYEWTRGPSFAATGLSSTRAWYVSRGNTTRLYTVTWSHNLGGMWAGSLNYEHTHYTSFTPEGMLCEVGHVNGINATVNIAIPYWAYTASGTVDRGTAPERNLPNDLITLQLDPRDASGNVMPYTLSVSKTASTHAVVTIACASPIVTLTAFFKAPIYNWPSSSILDSYMSNRPKL